MRSTSLLLLCLAGPVAVAQPQCSISLGSDVTICAGQTTTLNGPAGWPAYLWSTGAVTQNITVGAAGPYWCQVSYPSGNLFTNGDFTAGNTGFWTPYNYNANLQVEGNYYIGTNANTYHPNWVGTGTGNFFMANAGPAQQFQELICQTVDVCPGQTYTLSFAMANLANAGPPTLDWMVDWGTSFGNFTASAVQGQWNTYTTTYTTGPAQVSATFCLRVISNWAVGNDLGIDNLSLSSTVVLRDTVNVNVDPLPVVNLGPDVTLCPGQTLNLNAAVPGGTYVWQDGSTASSFLVSQAGTYSVTVTANGCSNTDAISVAYNLVPVVNLGPDASGCAGTGVALSVNVPGATNHQWSTGANGTSITALNSGIYWVDVTAANGCVVRDSITITIYPLPPVNLGPDRNICVGTTTVLDATVPGGTYLWNTGATTATITVGPGNYSVVATANGCTGTDAINIGNHPIPPLDLGPDTLLCPGEDIWLDATGNGYTYVWQDGTMASTLFVDQAGTYHVTITDVNGCIERDTVDVSYAVLAPVDLGNDTTICGGSNFLLDATTPGATGYLWNTNEVTPTITVNTTATYIVTVYQGFCEVVDFIDIQAIPPPNVNLGPDITLCPGETTLLDVTNPVMTYVWQDGSTASTYLVVQDGQYYVDVTAPDGCVGTDTVNVTYLGQNAVDLGPDTTICQGSPLVLDGTLPGSNSYLWNTGAVSPTLSVATSGLYWVEVTQGNCSQRDSINVLVNPVPIVDLGADTTLCPGATLLLDVTNPGATYAWSTGDITASITVSSATTVWVSVDLNGCVESDTLSIGYLNASQVDLGADTTICSGQSLTLTASIPGGTTTWSTGAVGGTLTVNTAGTYWATVAVGACSLSDTIVVNVTNLPPIALGNDTTICQGTTLVLDATSTGAAYLWDDASTSATRTVSATGTYWVETSLGNCVQSDTIDITVQPIPVVDIGNDTTLCPGAQVLLDATTAGATYLWQNGSVLATQVASTTGLYQVAVTVSGCTILDSAQVTVLTGSSLDLGADTLLCAGTSLLLDATTPGATYLWQDGSVQPTYLVSAAGNYSVTVTISGCTETDDIDVTYVPASFVDLGPDTIICPDQQIVLNASTAGATYLWQNGSTAPTQTISMGGTYHVRVTFNGCIDRDTVIVDEVPLPYPDLGDDLTVCEGDSVLLVVLPGDADVLWWNGSTNDSLLLFGSAPASVTFELQGCTTTDAVNITFIPFIDSLDLGPDAGYCLGTPVRLDATSPRSTYLWSTGENTPSILVEELGIYWVAISGTCVLASDTIEVIEGECPPEVWVPNAFTPDGNGNNEWFVPVIYGSIFSYEFNIFDRWGRIVFSSEEPGKAWDGSANGTDVQDGVYVWQLRYKSLTQEGVVQTEKLGHVTLLR